MNRLKMFESFNSNNDLQKIYLFSHSDKFSFSHIDSLVRSVSAKLFMLLMPPGVFPDSIINTIPIFNYGNNAELQSLIDNGKVIKENIYNLPENLINANSKIEFHKKTEHLPFIPKTVFKKEEALNLNFPIIAKPEGGSKGEGIEVFKTKEDLQKSESKFGVFSEKFDLKREFRIISIKGVLVFMAERIPENDKANSLREGKDIFDREGTLSKRSSYKWEKIDFKDESSKDLPEEKAFVDTCRAINEALSLEFLGVDIGLDSAGKLWCIEANTCPGLNKDQIVLIYLALFKDFYKREPNEYSMKLIKQYQDELMRANEDPAKFSFAPQQGLKFYYYDSKVDMDTGKRTGRSINTVKYNIEKSLGDTMLNIKKDKMTTESKVLDFQSFLNENYMEEKKKELHALGDSNIDIVKHDIKELISGKLKPTEVEPNNVNDKTALYIPFELEDKESGSRTVEAIFYLPKPLYVNFTYSYNFKPGQKSNDRLSPDDPDDYSLTGLEIDSVYYDEDVVEVTEEIKDMLIPYLKEYLPID